VSDKKVKGEQTLGVGPLRHPKNVEDEGGRRQRILIYGKLPTRFNSVTGTAMARGTAIDRPWDVDRNRGGERT